MKPVSASSAPIEQKPANEPVAQPDKIPQSVSSAPGFGTNTVSAEDALKGINNTEISPVSVAGGTGTAPVTPMAPGASVALGGMLEGKWAVEIMDALLPSLFVVLLHMADIKLRKSELQLTEKEKSTIAPIMQKCLDSVLLNFDSPWSALVITVGAIYGGKLAEKGLVTWIDKKQEKQQKEALDAKIKAADKEDNPAKYDHANQSAADIMNGDVTTPGPDGLPFSEEDISRYKKDKKVNREKAIKALKKQYGIRDAA